jgi:hypothetical protein
MPKNSTTFVASTADIRAILGALNERDLLEIAALQPTLRDVEEAATWLSGDRDVFGEGVPLKGVAADIVALLAPDDDEDSRNR